MKKNLSLCLVLLLIAGAYGFAGGQSGSQEGATAKKAEPAEIRFLNAGSNKNEIFTEVTNMFNELQDDVFVEFSTNTQNYHAQLKTQLATGDGPDIVTHLSGKTMIPYVEAGYLRDLSNEPILSRIDPNSLPMLSYQGKVYGVPLEAHAWGMYYNKTIFSDLGLKVPATISELERVTKAVAEAGYAPFSAAYMTQWTLGQIIHIGASPLVFDLTMEKMADFDSGKFNYDQPELRTFLDAVDLIKKYAYEKANDTDLSGQYALFATEKTAMMPQGTWSILQLRDLNPDLNMGMFAMPVSGDPDDVAIPVNFALSLYVINNENNLEPVRTFFDWFLNPASEARFYFDRVGLPCGILNMKPTLDPVAQDVANYLDKGQGTGWHSAQLFQGMGNEVNILMQSYMLDADMTHDEFIKQLNEIYASFIK